MNRLKQHPVRALAPVVILLLFTAFLCAPAGEGL
jgi:hypothetical protein